MECPICGSDELEILNSKQKESKKKFTEEYLLKCFDYLQQHYKQTQQAL